MNSEQGIKVWDRRAPAAIRRRWRRIVIALVSASIAVMVWMAMLAVARGETVAVDGEIVAIEVRPKVGAVDGPARDRIAELTLRVDALTQALEAVRYPSAANVLKFGCRLNDRTFDNGPVLNAAFARAGSYAELGREIYEFYLPGGGLWCATPIVLPRTTAVAIRGNGLALGYAESGYHGSKNFGGPASRIIYTGPADKPAVSYHGCGLRWEGVAIQRNEERVERVDPPHDGSVGFYVVGNVGLPTGKAYLAQWSIIGFDTAIEAAPEPLGNHGDDTLSGYLWVDNCWTAFKNHNPQAVNWHFQHTEVQHPCTVVFDYDNTGALVCDFLSLNSPALILKIGRTQSNALMYNLGTLRVDNHAAGWRLVDCAGVGAIALWVRGEIGKHAEPGPEPIKVVAGLANVHIELVRNWRPWP